MRQLFGTVLIALHLVGCSSTPPAKFYRLAAPSAAPPAEKISVGKRIGVGPFAVPEYLTRPQIVRRTGTTQLEVLEYERWAEPLDDALPRAVAYRLGREFGADVVELFPFRSREQIDLRLEVEVIRFEAVSSANEVQLEVQWHLLGDTLEQPQVFYFHSSSPIGGNQMGEEVESLSILVDQFSTAVSEKLVALFG